MRSLWKKYFKNYLIILLILSPVAFYTLSEIKSYYILLRQESLQRETALIAEVLKPAIGENDRARVETLLADLSNKTGIRVALIGTKPGGISTPIADPYALEAEEVREALSTGRGAAARREGPRNSTVLHAALPIEDEGGEVVAILRASAPLRFLLSGFPGFKRDVFVIAIFLSLVILVVTVASSRALSRSLSRLINISNEIARGNFDVTIPIGSREGEFGRLGSALGLMAERLKELFDEVAYEKTSLQAILGAMSEGVMAVSEEGRVILANDSLKDMFNVSQGQTGKPYWEAVRNREITELLEQVQRERAAQKREISLLYPRESTYQVCAIPLTAPVRGAMLILYDITEFKRLERIKADFVANVSHELRTPLTAVKGYVETLQDEEFEPEQREHFLGIVGRHTQRLINIVNDLLVLSEVERRAAPGVEPGELESEEIDLRDVLSSSKEALRSKIEAKNIHFTLEMEDRESLVTGDGFLLEQMFINLMDNALKYSPDEGKVRVSMGRENSSLRVHIEDAGIGIPPEHIPRIFERFYRVDKARSSKEGGTGLGLSIVKHIALLHGGRVEVESELGRGSRFTVVLPPSRES